MLAAQPLQNNATATSRIKAVLRHIRPPGDFFAAQIWKFQFETVKKAQNPASIPKRGFSHYVHANPPNIYRLFAGISIVLFGCSLICFLPVLSQGDCRPPVVPRLKKASDISPRQSGARGEDCLPQQPDVASDEP